MAVPQAVSASRIRDSLTKASRMDLSPDVSDSDLDERARDWTATVLVHMNRDTLPTNDVEKRAVENAVLKLIKIDFMRDSRPDDEELHSALNDAEDNVFSKLAVDGANQQVDDDLGRLGGGVVGGST